MPELFLKIIWKQFDMTGDCPRDLTYPWQPYFDGHVFQNLNLSYFENVRKAFL